MKNSHIKWDGHTHTEFCPHGNGDQTELMIQRAIELGFTHYSITEHAPLPPYLLKNLQLQKELDPTFQTFEEYFIYVEKLKYKFKDQIVIYCGLEIDYLPGFEDFTKNLIDKTASYLDDVLLALHFLPTTNGLELIDHTPENFQKQLIAFYGSTEAVHAAYWQTIETMVKTDFGINQPQRLAHLGLIYKFQQYFPTTQEKRQSLTDFQYLFQLIANKNYSLDFNIAGISCKYCLEPYLNHFFAKMCRDYQIPMVYGSDAHSIQSIGLYYEQFIWEQNF